MTGFGLFAMLHSPGPVSSRTIGNAIAKLTRSSPRRCSRKPTVEPTFVFIQDYHFALLPRMLRNANANLIVAQFWHIPWPNREVFRSFPWQEEIARRIARERPARFPPAAHCQNFLETSRSQSLRRVVDPINVARLRGVASQPWFDAFPISIDFDDHSALRTTPAK